MGRFSFGGALLGARRALTGSRAPETDDGRERPAQPGSASTPAASTRPSTIGIASVLDLRCTAGPHDGAGRDGDASASAVGMGLGASALGMGLGASAVGASEDAREHLVRLRIECDGREPWLLALRVLLTPDEIRALAPGIPFPVRFAPGDANVRELVDAADPLVRDLLLRRRIALGLIPPEVARARVHGELVPGRVIRSRPTGRSLDDQIEVAVSVRVLPGRTRSPWDADTRAFVHPDTLIRLAPGRSIAVRYLPSDPFVVAISLEDPGAPAR